MLGKLKKKKKKKYVNYSLLHLILINKKNVGNEKKWIRIMKWRGEKVDMNN